MTRIRLSNRANIAGGHHETGDVVVVDDDVAQNMVFLGRAVLVEDEIEREVRAVPETAARTTARSRVRTGRTSPETRKVIDSGPVRMQASTESGA